MGLEWQDVDFKTGIVSINRSSQYLADKGIFTKTPKTESSIREVAIPDFVVSLLEEYKLWYDEQKSFYGELWTNSNRLFVQADGKPMHPSTISKWFVKYVAQIGLPVINFHGLRHTNATLLISQNIDVAVVAARLGLISMCILLFLIIEMQEMYYKTCYYKKTSLKSFFKFH